MRGGSAARPETPSGELFEASGNPGNVMGNAGSVLLRLMAILGVAAPVFAGLWLHSRASLSDAERRLAEVSDERVRADRNLSAAKLAADQAKAELADFKKKAVISNEHLMFEEAAEATRDQEWDAAVDLNRRFLEHFPDSPMALTATQALKVATKARVAAEERAKAEEVARSLDSVSIAEIYADIGRFKGKTLVRTVDCRPITELMATAARFDSHCDVGSEDVRVLYSGGSDVRRLASLPRGLAGSFEYTGVFKVVGREPYGDGVVLRFMSLEGE